jgi:hypothetical protein
MNTSVRAPLDNDLAEDLHRAVSLLEDWLLHASPETLDELADFAYGPSHHGQDQLRWIIDLLGETAARLRPAPLPAPAETTTETTTTETMTTETMTTEPTSAQRGPSR